MRLDKIAIASFAMWMTAAASASTINVISADNDYGMQLWFKVNGVEQSLFASPYIVSVDGGAQQQAYCVDFFTSSNYQSYVVNANPPSELIGRIYSSFVGNVKAAINTDRNLYGAALTIALWEASVDGGGPLSLSNGVFQQSMTNPWSAQLVNIINSYLNAANGGSLQPIAPGVVVYTGATEKMQALITDGGPAVPEPSTWLLIGSSLAGFGLLRRRR